MSDAPVTTHGSMLQRVQRLVERTESLTAARAEAAQHVRSTHDTERDRHQRAERDERTAIENDRLSAVAAAQATHESSTRQIRADLEQKLTTVRDRHETARSTLIEKAEENDRTARKKMQEAIWLADTMYEASEDKPAERERINVQGIDGRLREIQRSVELASDRLSRSRMPSPRVDPAADSGIAPDEAVADAEPLSDETIEADKATLETAVTRSVEIAAAAVQPKSMRLFAGLMLPAVLLITTALGAGVAVGLQMGGIVGAEMGAAGAGAVGAGIGLALPAAVAAGLFALLRSRMGRLVSELDALGSGAVDASERLRIEAGRRRRAEERELIETREREAKRAKTTYGPIIEEIASRVTTKLASLDERVADELERLETRRDRLLAEADQLRDEALEAAERRAAERTTALDTAHQDQSSTLEADYRREWSDVTRTWNEGMAACEDERATLGGETAALFPAWTDDSWSAWDPPMEFAPAARVGTITVDRDALPGGRPDHEDFDDPMPASFELPVTLDFPERCSLLVRTDPDGRDRALATLRATMMRLLVAVPPGKAQFTIFDPVGLGESFAGFMTLGDYDDQFVGGRIWTEPRHIEQRLTDLTEHMENVIQKYLRNAYDSIAAYNEAAGEIAEPYRFLVIADLPAGFNEQAAQRLASIISSGPRCGVFTLIVLDERRPLPPGLTEEDLAQHAVILRERDGRLTIDDDVLGRWPFVPESPTPEAQATELLHRVGTASKDARRVEVPFDVIAPDADTVWSRTSEKTVMVPLGRAGATRLQELLIGPGTSQHALIAGKTGSGKSTLLHVLVTNLALWYGPDEICFYLVDFKKGVEFKTYATHDLPHARAVAVESDREFGLSVLERIDEELRRRGEAYRDAGVQDLAGFRAARPGVAMPRVLLIIDEFQELFVEDDKIGQDAALLMDRIVRQGRAFGIHVLLGSQTLGGSYSLPRSTLGQMQVRIALQCSETDAFLIMSDDNAAARLLSRPGEAIYNDQGGRIEGNSPFQIVWLPEPVREERLTDLRTRADAAGWSRPEPLVVFEGNEAADVRANDRLERVVQGDAVAPADQPAAPTGGPSEAAGGSGDTAKRSPLRDLASRAARLVGGRPDEGQPATSVAAMAWLGEAIAIKGPTEAVFRRRSGANLLIVGQRDEAALAMMMLSGLALAGQAVPAGDMPSLIVLDGSPPDAPHAGWLAAALHGLRAPAVFPAYREVDAELERLAAVVRDRSARDASTDPPIFLLVHGLQRYRSLRPSDEFGFSMDGDGGATPDKLFAEIIRDGPPVGVHCLTWCDTATNLMRSLPRQGLREFDLRVVFQMSSADSTQVIDVPTATSLGLQRAFFYSEEAGRLEKFRPYSVPDPAWLAQVRDRLAAADGAPAARPAAEASGPGDGTGSHGSPASPAAPEDAGTNGHADTVARDAPAPGGGGPSPLGSLDELESMLDDQRPKRSDDG